MDDKMQKIKEHVKKLNNDFENLVVRINLLAKSKEDSQNLGNLIAPVRLHITDLKNIIQSN